VIAQPFQQPLEVLLGRFATRCDAITARVVGRTAEGDAVTWARFAREQDDVDSVEADLRWMSAAAHVMDDPRARLTSGTPGMPDVVVSVPIGAPGRVIGALCGGFHTQVLTEAAVVLWTASGFAQTMALCVDDPQGFGRMLGAAEIDPLTGCRSPLAMWETLEREISRADRQRSPLTCAFIDLDHFKQVNEDSGHLGGDRILAAVGAELCACVRGYDTVARFGGDEFVVILPNSTEKQARALVTRMQRQVEATTTPLARAPVTASVGVAQWRFGEDAASLVERADLRMLENKRIARDAISQ
jgi:diguanylate cyclase (GGDEF)-like protein